MFSADPGAIQAARVLTCTHATTVRWCTSRAAHRLYISFITHLFLRQRGIPDWRTLGNVLRGRTRPLATMGCAREIPGPTSYRARSTIEKPTSVPSPSKHAIAATVSRIACRAPRSWTS